VRTRVRYVDGLHALALAMGSSMTCRGHRRVRAWGFLPRGGGGVQPHGLRRRRHPRPCVCRRAGDAPPAQEAVVRRGRGSPALRVPRRVWPGPRPPRRCVAVWSSVVWKAALRQDHRWRSPAPRPVHAAAGVVQRQRLRQYRLQQRRGTGPRVL
jgi:hypothetical protein